MNLSIELDMLIEWQAAVDGGRLQNRAESSAYFGLTRNGKRRSRLTSSPRARCPHCVYTMISYGRLPPAPLAL
jgi:hypothetical protein